MFGAPGYLGITCAGFKRNPHMSTDHRFAINPGESYWSKWIIPPILGLNIRKYCSWNHLVLVFYLVTVCISCQALDINWLELQNDSPNPLKMSSTPLLVSKKPSKDLACHWSGTSKSNMRFSEMEEIMHHLMGSSSIIYMVLWVPGGAGCLPSTVVACKIDVVANCFGKCPWHIYDTYNIYIYHTHLLDWATTNDHWTIPRNVHDDHIFMSFQQYPEQSWWWTCKCRVAHSLTPSSN